MVTEIDYSGENVKIIAANGDTFYAKKVISSLPLGVLKANDVTFTPSLPQKHQKAIQSLGNRIYNKIIATLNKPFWKEDAADHAYLEIVPGWFKKDVAFHSGIILNK